MLRILNKISFSQKDNRMKYIADVDKAREFFFSSKSQNLKFLLNQRFSWMNNFINDNDRGIEVGSGAGFSKEYIKKLSILLAGRT